MQVVAPPTNNERPEARAEMRLRGEGIPFQKAELAGRAEGGRRHRATATQWNVPWKRHVQLINGAVSASTKPRLHWSGIFQAPTPLVRHLSSPDSTGLAPIKPRLHWSGTYQAPTLHVWHRPQHYSQLTFPLQLPSINHVHISRYEKPSATRAAGLRRGRTEYVLLTNYLVVKGRFRGLLPTRLHTSAWVVLESSLLLPAGRGRGAKTSCRAERGRKGRDALSAFSSWFSAARGSVAQRFSGAKIANDVGASDFRE